MSDSELTSITTAFQDSVHTTLLDFGVAPAIAYEISRDPSSILEIDEYQDALDVDLDALV